MIKILITDKTDESIITMLQNAGFSVDYKPDISRGELLKIIKDYDAILVRGRTKVDKEVIDRAEKLKLIGRIGVGLDNIDLKTAKEKGIEVVNAGAATADSVAELTIGALITLVRKIHIGDELYRRGIWGKNHCAGTQLNGKTLGVIGFGNIGSRVGKIALAMGMKVIAFDVIKDLVTNSGLEVEYVDLDELYQKSDIITIHVPLLEATKGMINREAIEKMKDGVILLNAARIELFDLPAVIDGLEKGKIGGVYVDTELKPNDPHMRRLMGFPSVLITPHIGAQTKEAQKRAVEVIAQKVISKFQ